MIYRFLIVSLLFLGSCSGGSKKDSSNDPSIISQEDTTTDELAATNRKPIARIVAHIGSTPDDLHPINSHSTAQIELFTYLHTSLVKDDIINQKIAPDALVRIPEYNQATKRYQCELRDYLRFDDGSPITSEDVAFSFKLQVCPNMLNGARKGNLENIKRFEIIDDTHFNLVCPNPNIEDVSLWSQNSILQKSVFDSAGVFNNVSFEQLQKEEDIPQAVTDWVETFNGAAYGTKARWIIGAGPYKLAAWTDNEVILRKKENHWSSKSDIWLHQSNAEQLIFKVNKDPNAKYLDIKNQVVDISIGFTSRQMAQMQEDSFIVANYNQYYVSTYSFTLISLNLRPEVVNRSSIFTDEKVRQAFAHALPVQKAIDLLSNGTAERIASPISINKPEHNDNLSPYDFDIKKAKLLLKEAGWVDSDQDGILDRTVDGKKENLRIGLMTIPIQIFESIGKILIEGLKQAGFDAYLDAPEDWKSRLSETHDFDCMLHSISGSFGPIYPLSLYKSEAYPAGSNFSGYSNPEVDSLSDQISRTLDYETRKQLLDRFQEIVYEDVPYALFTTGKRGVLVHKRFGEVNPSGALPVLLLNTLELKE